MNKSPWNFHPVKEKVYETSLYVTSAAMTIGGTAYFISPWLSAISTSIAIAISALPTPPKRNYKNASAHLFPDSLSKTDREETLSAFNRIVKKTELEDTTPRLILSSKTDTYFSSSADMVNNIVTIGKDDYNNQKSLPFIMGHEVGHLKTDSGAHIRTFSILNNLATSFCFSSYISSRMLLTPFSDTLTALNFITEAAPDLITMACITTASHSTGGLANKSSEYRADRNGLHACDNDIESARSFFSSCKYEGLHGLWRRITMPNLDNRLTRLEAQYQENIDTNNKVELSPQ